MNNSGNKTDDDIDLNFKNKDHVILHHTDTRYKSLGLRLILKNQTTPGVIKSKLSLSLFCFKNH